MSSGRSRATVQVAVGVVLLLVGALFFFVAALDAMGITQTESSGTYLVLIEASAICTPTTIVPGIILIYYGRKTRRESGQLAEFAAWVKTYRRIGLADLAKKLGKTEYETEKVLIGCVEKGLLQGFVDRSTSEFVLQAAAGREHFVGKCPGCATSLQRRYLDGETVICPYCGTVIAGPSSPAGTPAG